MCIYVWWVGSAFISSSSSSSVSLEEGSSRTCVGAVPRDLSLYDIMSGIRWLLLQSNIVCCTILSVDRCSLGNTSLHRDKMTVHCTIPYYTIQNVLQDHSNTKLDRIIHYTTIFSQFYFGKKHFCSSTGVQMCSQIIHSIFGPTNEQILVI